MQARTSCEFPWRTSTRHGRRPPQTSTQHSNGGMRSGKADSNRANPSTPTYFRFVVCGLGRGIDGITASLRSYVASKATSPLLGFKLRPDLRDFFGQKSQQGLIVIGAAKAQSRLSSLDKGVVSEAWAGRLSAPTSSLIVDARRRQARLAPASPLRSSTRRKPWRFRPAGISFPTRSRPQLNISGGPAIQNRQSKAR